MLTQGPAPDRKCKLIISSFVTLSHLLDCLICTRNAMLVILLLRTMGRWDKWGWLIFIRVWVVGQVEGIILQFLFSLVLLYFVASHSESLYLDG